MAQSRQQHERAGACDDQNIGESEKIGKPRATLTINAGGQRKRGDQTENPAPVCVKPSMIPNACGSAPVHARIKNVPPKKTVTLMALG